VVNLDNGLTSELVRRMQPVVNAKSYEVQTKNCGGWTPIMGFEKTNLRSPTIPKARGKRSQRPFNPRQNFIGDEVTNLISISGLQSETPHVVSTNSINVARFPCGISRFNIQGQKTYKPLLTMGKV